MKFEMEIATFSQFILIVKVVVLEERSWVELFMKAEWFHYSNIHCWYDHYSAALLFPKMVCELQ